MNEPEKLSTDTPVRIDIQSEKQESLTREERIRIRAYELFEARNREPGRAEEDWVRAEAEIAGEPAERNA